MKLKTILLTFLLIFPVIIYPQIVIDHNCWDISRIPDSYLDNAKTNLKIFYVHKSHGEQLVVDGVTQVYNTINNKYAFAAGWDLQSNPAALNIANRGSYGPADYWTTDAGLQQTINYLDSKPAINVSGFMWCSDLNYATEEYVNQYLTNIAYLEDMYSGLAGKKRKVTFIYFTSNMNKNPWDISIDYNKYLRNEQIRAWVKDNPAKNRVLFDFADMDCYWYNTSTNAWEMGTEVYNSTTIPVMLDRYNTEVQDHTTWENIEHKGRAFWWMCAQLAGWDPASSMPVELTDFAGIYSNNGIKLTWSTASELNNAGFIIERGSVSTNNKVTDIKRIAFIEGKGNSNTINNYQFVDKLIPQTGRYCYYLLQLDIDGNIKPEKQIEVNFESPKNFELFQNYPNPFNPSTTIKYQVANKSNVELKVFDLLGREIVTLVNEIKEAGVYQTHFNASGLASGVYLYRICADGYSISKKLTILK